MVMDTSKFHRVVRHRATAHQATVHPTKGRKSFTTMPLLRMELLLAARPLTVKNAIKHQSTLRVLKIKPPLKVAFQPLEQFLFVAKLSITFLTPRDRFQR